MTHLCSASQDFSQSHRHLKNCLSISVAVLPQFPRNSFDFSDPFFYYSLNLFCLPYQTKRNFQRSVQKITNLKFIFTRVRSRDYENLQWSGDKSRKCNSRNLFLKLWASFANPSFSLTLKTQQIYIKYLIDLYYRVKLALEM